MITFKEKEDGSILMIDERMGQAITSEISAVNSNLLSLTESFTEYGQEVNEELLRVAVLKGSRGLLDKKVAEFREWAHSANCPAYMYEDGERRAAESLPEKMLHQLDIVQSIFFDHYRNTKIGRAIQKDDFVYIPELNALQMSEAFVESARQGNERELPKDTVSDIDKIAKLLNELRKIDAKGFEIMGICKQLFGNRYALAEGRCPEINRETIINAVYQGPFLLVGPTAETVKREHPDWYRDWSALPTARL